MKLKNWLDWVTFIILFIGGLNWGLIGIARFNIVAAIFGMSMVANIIYIVIGVCAIYLIIRACTCCKKDGSCDVSTPQPPQAPRPPQPPQQP